MHFHIGWPQAVYIGLAVFSLLYVAANHGKPREPYDVSTYTIATVLGAALVYWGGFFG